MKGCIVMILSVLEEDMSRLLVCAYAVVAGMMLVDQDRGPQEKLPESASERLSLSDSA